MMVAACGLFVLGAVVIGACVVGAFIIDAAVGSLGCIDE